MQRHENEVRNKHVESVWFPCLDEGSTPSSSTFRIDELKIDELVVIIIPNYSFIIPNLKSTRALLVAKAL